MSIPVTEEFLEGITRATLIELAADRGIETCERPIDRSELYVAEEAFLCGTAVGVVPLIEVDHRPIGEGAPGPLSCELRALYQGVVRGKEPRYRRWCTPVYHAAVPSGTLC